MGKRKRGERMVNPKPFLVEEPTAVLKPRFKAAKRHQQEEQGILKTLSEKILKEAFTQQREILDEENDERSTEAGFSAITEVPVHDEEEDIDNFGGFNETQSQSGDYEDQINEDDEKLLEAFLSKDNGPQRTLGDVIAARIKAQDAALSSEARHSPKLDDVVVEHYKAVGKSLSTYTCGRLPKAIKAIKDIPNELHWVELLYLTEPEKWSPSAVYQTTRLFASNMTSEKVEKFYKLVILPRVREDIRKHKILPFALYETLKKALYKPPAFNKGILFPLFESGTCNLREAVIVGSVLQKMSIPRHDAGATLLILAEMDYCGTTSYIIKILIDKKYALSYRVIDALVAHFMRFLDDPRTMPVIWHQTLLTLVQRYKHELRKEDKENLRILMQRQVHYLVTPEILRELNNSRNRGEKEEVNMMPIKPFKENIFDLPDVPIEDEP